MKNKIIFKLLLATAVIKSQPALAEVDLSEGSFILREKSSPLEMIYNSRSVHQGLLGFGWCSPYEDAVDPIKRTVLKLRDCRAGKVIAFKLAPELRAPSSDSRSFLSGNHKIVEQNNKYILSDDSGVRTFDKNGKLLKVQDERGKFTQVIYDKNGFLKEIISGRKDSLKLSVDPQTGRVVEVIGSNGARTRLTFLKNNLISIYAPKVTKYFKYDEVANLREIISGKKITRVDYNKLDQVTSVQVRSDCFETYSYNSVSLISRAEVTTNCKGINNKRLVDFFYSKNGAGDYILEKVLTKTVQLRSARLPANQQELN